MIEFLEAAEPFEEMLTGLSEVALIIRDDPEHVARAHEMLLSPGGVGQAPAALYVLPREI